jgi:hypothetical protein
MKRVPRYLQDGPEPVAVQDQFVAFIRGTVPSKKAMVTVPAFTNILSA